MSVRNYLSASEGMVWRYENGGRVKWNGLICLLDFKWMRKLEIERGGGGDDRRDLI